VASVDVESSKYHVLLIGIDSYPERPLRGCVNDVDAMRQFLIDRMGVPAKNIRELIASSQPPERTTPPLEPTLQNIVAALTELASGRVGAADRVFIYYSGHGARVVTAEATGKVAREALVPLDFRTADGGVRLLFDLELNRLLHAIAARTPYLTLVLDCCHSAGTFRGDSSAIRQLELKEEVPFQSVLPSLPDSALAHRGLLGGAGLKFQAVAACRENELAQERVNLVTHKMQGVMTSSLLEVLEECEQPAETRWSDLWPRLLARVAAQNPQQAPALLGRYERPVLGGPWQPADRGLPVRAVGSEYRIEAGSLLGITEEAELAVYGKEPLLFPTLGSPEEGAARKLTLRVTRAHRSHAFAQALTGLTGELPAGTRARLIKPGRLERLRVGLEPHEPKVEEALARSPLVQVLPSGEPDAELRVRVVPHGYALSDDLCFPDALTGQGPDGALPELSSTSSLEVLPRLVEHYARYNTVLRLARRSQDLPGALRLSLLDCTHLEGVDPQQPQLPELPPGPCTTYALQSEHPFCVRVTNTSRQDLHVTVFNCTASGRVELLGSLQLPPEAAHVLWMDTLGQPFLPWLGIQHPVGIERLVAIGTTRHDVDLSYLELGPSFEEVAAATYKEVRRPSPAAPSELWTACAVMLRLAR
jgi:hypothetical protein